MKIVPAQHTGAMSVTRYSIKLASKAAAESLFERARRNLLNVNDWHTIAGPHSAVFEIIDERGEKITGDVKKGNYLRINIPAIPGSPAGNGADWVKVERINEQVNLNYQSIAISVRPAPSPIDNETEVAHFFADEATSTFSIERRDRVVVASVNGRNETPNTETKTIRARIRNFFVAIGAMLGLNKPQWKSLVKGLIKKRL
jgi:hypothetical protein